MPYMIDDSEAMYSAAKCAYAALFHCDGGVSSDRPWESWRPKRLCFSNPSRGRETRSFSVGINCSSLDLSHRFLCFCERFLRSFVFMLSYFTTMEESHFFDDWQS